MQAWHFLKADMTAGHGKEPAWTEGEERTLSARTKLVICKKGYHSSPTPFDALQFATGAMLCLVEIGEPADTQPDKYVSRSRKLLKVVDISRQAREFACDVAEEALNLDVQHGRTVDERSRAAIEVARRFARGEASEPELKAAATAAYGAADAADTAAYAGAYAAAAAVGGGAVAAAVDAVDAAAAAYGAYAAYYGAYAAYAAKFNALVAPLFETAEVSS